MRTFTLLIAFIFSCATLHAQDKEEPTEKQKAKQEKKETRKAVKAQKVADDKFLFTPVASVHRPETGGLLSADALCSFKTKKTDTLIQRSSMPFTFAYTTTRAIVINTQLTSYWFKDKMRIYGEYPQLGTPFDLKGYQWGRYGDQGMFFFIAECRQAFLKDNGSLGKQVALVWLDFRTIFNDELIAANDLHWLPNYETRYRFELQPRMNLQLNFGIGKETSEFNFNFNQAF